MPDNHRTNALRPGGCSKMNKPQAHTAGMSIVNTTLREKSQVQEDTTLSLWSTTARKLKYAAEVQRVLTTVGGWAGQGWGWAPLVSWMLITFCVLIWIRSTQVGSVSEYASIHTHTHTLTTYICILPLHYIHLTQKLEYLNIHQDTSHVLYTCIYTFTYLDIIFTLKTQKFLPGLTHLLPIREDRVLQENVTEEYNKLQK